MSRCIATYRIYDDQADFRKKATSIAVGMTVGAGPSRKPSVKRCRSILAKLLTFRFTRAGSQAPVRRRQHCLSGH